MRLARTAARDGVYTAQAARLVLSLGWWLLAGGLAATVAEGFARLNLLGLLVTWHQPTARSPSNASSPGAGPRRTMDRKSLRLSAPGRRWYRLPMRQYMHQHPPQTPVESKRSSNAGHSSGVRPDDHREALVLPGARAAGLLRAGGTGPLSVLAVAQATGAD
jgi:hypothetical protein